MKVIFNTPEKDTRKAVFANSWRQTEYREVTIISHQKGNLILTETCEGRFNEMEDIKELYFTGKKIDLFKILETRANVKVLKVNKNNDGYSITLKVPYWDNGTPKSIEVNLTAHYYDSDKTIADAVQAGFIPSIFFLER